MIVVQGTITKGMKMTREQIIDAMLNRTVVYVNGKACFINGIQMEDGSGYSFNVQIGDKTVYVRCPRPSLHLK